MKLIRQKCTLLAMPRNPEKLIESICGGDLNRDKLIDKLVNEKSDLFDHIMVTMKFITDIATAGKLAQYNWNKLSQERIGGNYCKSDKLEFIIPEWSDIEEKLWYDVDVMRMYDGTAEAEWYKQLVRASNTYLDVLRSHGQEQAASVLPVSLKTTVVATAGIQKWAKIVLSQTDDAQVAALFTMAHNILYDSMELYQAISKLI